MIGGIAPDRAAVSALFLCNGMLFGSWAPKLPALMRRLDIDEGTAGLLVLCLGLGSMTVMPIFAAITARHGSAVAASLSSLLALPVLLMLSVLPGLPPTVLGVFLFGGFLGGMDVAINANALAVEQMRGRAILSSCHGFWSLGGVFGAGMGGVLLGGFGEVVHALSVTAAGAGLLALALPRLLRDRPDPRDSRPSLRLPRTALPYLIGLVGLACMIPEGAIIDWAAVYLYRDMGASISVAGWGYAACAASMAAIRFIGDRVRNRLGAVLTFRFSAVIAMLGLTLAAIAPNPGLAIAGFGVAGLGLANLVPIVFSAAGHLPGLARGVGLSVVTMMGYSGILLAPGTIGQLAEHVGFSRIFQALAALLLPPLLLSSRLGAADAPTLRGGPGGPAASAPLPDDQR